MFSIEIECDREDQEMLVAELWEQGSAGIVELTPSRVRAFFEDAIDRNVLLQLYPGSALRKEEERDWVQSARQLMQPMEVGLRFFLVPEWRGDPAPAGRFRLTVNPGMAFGTGVHETTRLCIEGLEEFLKPGMSVLDVGTGSGILARAARMLGAGRIIACDTDPVAIEVAGEGFIGSADAVASQSTDLVVANINAETIMRLAGELRRVVRPGGVLLVSGLEVDEAEQVASTLVGNVRTKGNWAMLAGHV
jgi:ribosomal protein L11 methyltransferase